MKLNKLSVLITLALGICAQPGFAQETETSGDNSTDDSLVEVIMVTAQKRSESLQDVPIAMTVTTEEQLQRDQIYTVTDLQRTTPALEITQSFGGEQNGGGRMRGIGTNVFNESGSASVAIVVDQVPQGNTPSPQLFDLAQVEILRGPQGTLFGQTASAGVIQVTTKAPDFERISGEIGADYNWDDVDRTVIRGALNVPVSDYSALRFAGRFIQEKGLQRNVFLNQDNQADEASYRIRYRNAELDYLNVDIIAEFNKQEFDGTNFFAPAITPTLESSLTNYQGCGLTDIQRRAKDYCAEDMSQESRENKGLSAIVSWSLDEHTLTSVTAYKEKTVEEKLRNYSRRIGVPVAVMANNREEGKQVSQEVRLSSDHSEPLQYIVGLFYSNYDFTTSPMTNAPFGNPLEQVGFGVCATSAEAVPPVPSLQALFSAQGFWCPVPVTFTKEDINVESQAIFTDLTYEITDDMTVFGGLRYTIQNSEFGIGANGPVTNTGDAEDKEISGRLGLRWTISDNNMVYTSISRGFKGSLIAINPNPGVAPNILSPELATSFEVGNKVSFMKGRLSVDSNIFYTKVADFQAQRSVYVDAELVTISSNVPEVISQGIELDILGRVTDNLRINTGYIYASVEYPDEFAGDDGTDLGGKQLVYAPEHKFTFSGEYFAPVQETTEFFANINAVYKSDIRLVASANPLFSYDAHWNIGASVGLRNTYNDWRVSLFVRNLTDEPAPVGYLSGDFSGAFDGGVRALPASGITTRQIGAAFDYRF
mgnify:CR=1 FL=1